MKNIATLPLSIALALGPCVANTSQTDGGNLISEPENSMAVSQDESNSLSADQKERLRNLIQASGVSLDEEKVSTLVGAISNMYWIEPKERLEILVRMKNSRILERCGEVHDILRLFNVISTFSEEKYQTVLNKIKTSGAWKKCRNADEIRGFLALYGNLEAAFSVLDGFLIRTCLVEYGHLEDLLRWHKRQNNLPAMTILWSEKHDEKELRLNWKLYLFYHGFYAPNKQIEGVVKDMISKDAQLTDDQSKKRTLGKITNLLGEDHAFSRACSTLLLTRENPEEVLETLPSNPSVRKRKSSPWFLKLWHRPRRHQDDANWETLVANQGTSEDTPLIL